MSSEAFLDPQNAPKSLEVGATPQTPLEELIAGFKGAYFKASTCKGRRGKGWKGRWRGDKISYAPVVDQKPLCRR